jgi:ribonuclease HI
MKNVIIFTDGAARGNPGPGGWGSIVVEETNVTELGGREPHTTNNRMELTAVISALEFISTLAPHTSQHITVYTDSSYVLNGSTKWLAGWKRNDWKTKAKGEVINIDLWERMDEALGSVGKVSWNLIKGHSGIPANERCDVIATSFADNKNLNLYSGSASDYSVSLSVEASKAKSPKLKAKTSSAPAFSYVSSLNGEIATHATWKECEARVKGKSKALFKKSFSLADEKAIIDQWKKSFRS